MDQNVSKYTMWLKVGSSTTGKEGLAVPVQYEMRGYNSLLGSHFDHYFLSYDNFSRDVRFLMTQCPTFTWASLAMGGLRLGLTLSTI